MGSRSISETQFTFDPDYSPPNTVDLASHQVLETLAAAEEVADQVAKGGVTASVGKKQGSKRKIISLNYDSDDSDVQITPQTQRSKPRRKSSFGTATGKPMLQSTINGGIGSSSQVCRKEKSVPLKAVIRGGRRNSPIKAPNKKVTQSQKKKEKVVEDIPKLGDELKGEGNDEIDGDGNGKFAGDGDEEDLPSFQSIVDGV